MTEASEAVGNIMNEMISEVVRQGEDILLMMRKGHVSPPRECSFYLPKLEESGSVYEHPVRGIYCVCERCKIIRRRSSEAVPNVHCTEKVQCPLKNCLFNIIAESCAMLDTEPDKKLMLNHIRKDLCQAVDEVDKRIDEMDRRSNDVLRY